MNILRTYMRWLHTRWPAGTVEKLPVVADDGSTSVPGLYVTGDLRGVPLLKFATDSGARAARTIAAGLDPARERDVVDVAVVGAGVSGMAAALEARRLGLSIAVFEANEPFATVADFPRGKPIFTYPKDMDPAGELAVTANVKEALYDELRHQTLEGDDPVPVRHARVERVRRAGAHLELVLDEGERVAAHRVVCALGRSGNFRRLGVPGEGRDTVYNRLHDPNDFRARSALVVGGGDSALEVAIALARAGARVTLSYRRAQFNRPRPENVEGVADLASDRDGRTAAVETPSSARVTTAAGSYMGPEETPGSLRLALSTRVTAIRDGEADIEHEDGRKETVAADVIFPMIGREPPLDFFRRSGVKIAGDRGVRWWVTLVLMLALTTFVYHWKKTGTWLPIAEAFEAHRWFPFALPGAMARWGAAWRDPSTLPGTLRLSAGSPGFWYALAYTALIVVFGIRRVRRRRTPYVTAQTVTLAAVQLIPLFLLPYLVLPWLGHLGAFDAGAGRSFADALFPAVSYDPNGREYWRAFGLILAWPLFLWNVFSGAPLLWWLVISLVQTFVLIPVALFLYGKGAYCGWVCSCGAMAETLGDTHRHKMPHGPGWNRLNMIGQVFLLAATVLLILRVVSWVSPGGWAEAAYNAGLNTDRYGGLPVLNYAWFVDLFWAGILGFGLYFHFSGRVWCRFACPLAALMHIYTRFSRFRIFAEKKKCISCNVCTAVCHQGIDVMSFANKGLGMRDPECVRCSACVQMCPTGVLSFGRVDRRGNPAHTDRLPASPVRMREDG